MEEKTDIARSDHAPNTSIKQEFIAWLTEIRAHWFQSIDEPLNHKKRFGYAFAGSLTWVIVIFWERFLKSMDNDLLGPWLLLQIIWIPLIAFALIIPFWFAWLVSWRERPIGPIRLFFEGILNAYRGNVATQHFQPTNDERSFVMEFHSGTTRTSITIVLTVLIIVMFTFDGVYAQGEPTHTDVAPMSVYQVRDTSELDWFTTTRWALQWYFVPEALWNVVPLYAYKFQTVCSKSERGYLGQAAIVGDLNDLIKIWEDDPTKSHVTVAGAGVAPSGSKKDQLGALMYTDVNIAIDRFQSYHNVKCQDDEPLESAKDWFVATTYPFPQTPPSRQFVGEMPLAFSVPYADHRQSE